MSPADIKRLLARPGYAIVGGSRDDPDAVPAIVPRGKSSNENHAGSPLSNPKPKRHKAPALAIPIQGKAESIPRTVVRFIGYRVRPLDPDNFAGGCKDAIDGLRHAGLISGDEPWRMKLETEQVKVSHVADECTVIEIETP